jgi:hypothetical protein
MILILGATRPEGRGFRRVIVCAARQFAKNDASKRYADVMNRLGHSYGRFQVSASLAAKSRAAITRSNALLGKLGAKSLYRNGRYAARPLPQASI